MSCCRWLSIAMNSHVLSLQYLLVGYNAALRKNQLLFKLKNEVNCISTTEVDLCLLLSLWLDKIWLSVGLQVMALVDIIINKVSEKSQRDCLVGHEWQWKESIVLFQHVAQSISGIKNGFSKAVNINFLQKLWASFISSETCFVPALMLILRMCTAHLLLNWSASIICSLIISDQFPSHWVMLLLALFISVWH